MRARLKPTLFAIIGVLVLIAGGIAWHRFASEARLAGPAVAAPAPGIPVTEGRVERRDVPIWLSGIGAIRPLNSVTVKARVDGALDRVAFAEGQEVHAGDMLAQIDPRPFQAQLKQALANKAKDEAQLANTRLDLARASKLASKGFAAAQTVDTQKAQVAALEATVQADQAAIDTAQLQLDFTRIQAPLDGRTGLRLVDAGSIVHAGDPNGLVTVTQMQPIAALFTLSQDDLPDILAAMAQGEPQVIAYARDSDRQLAAGTLVFVDSQVDATTGQVRLKAEFDNAARSLWPGEFVTARVRVKTIKDATVIPAKAVQRAQNGTYVFRVRADDTVEVQPVTVAPADQATAIVAQGLAPGERIVVEGQYRLQAGSRIEARP
jgi:multidrug efflux system membrane fusion protein